MISLPTFPPESAEKALCAAEQAGVARDVLLASTGLDWSNGPSPLRFDQLSAIYEQAARRTGDDAFGLHVGERTSPRMYGMLGYGAANSNTLGDALAHLADFGRLWTDAAGLEIERERKTVRVRYWHHGALPPEQRRQESEQMLAAVLAFISGATGGAAAPIETRFEHRAPPDVSEHRRIFGCPVTFGTPATEIILSARALDLPLAGSDPALGALIKVEAQASLARQPRRDPLVAQVQALVQAALAAAGDVSLQAIAARLGIGPRTLQRRLRAAGPSFSQAVEEARIGAAKRLLEDPRQALGEIAFRLGYSQPSAFHRAFRRRTGTTPRAFRSALQAGEERR